MLQLACKGYSNSTQHICKDVAGQDASKQAAGCVLLSVPVGPVLAAGVYPMSCMVLGAVQRIYSPWLA